MQKYLITSPLFYTDTLAQFIKNLEHSLTLHQPSFALYRDKQNPEYKTLASTFITLCLNMPHTKSFLHRDFTLAKSLNAVGVHLTSQQFDDIPKAKNLGLEVIISTHTHEEVKRAEELGADYVTYSPIFHSPNKGEPKGVKDLRDLVKSTHINIFALGGILNTSEVAMIKKTQAYGFASIRYFTQE